MNKNRGQMDRTEFRLAHADTMFVQTIFPNLEPDEIRKETFAYPPCWGILDAGMTMEKHKHPMPEFYVFVQGKGRMLLGEESFDVAAGASVNIPPDELHEVINPETAVEPLVWVSIGLKAID